MVTHCPDIHDADNNECTTDTCSNGVCVHTPVNVDDNDACMQTPPGRHEPILMPLLF
jgi:hypothetical protein